MNVTCPNCATVYRVDPAKVPEAGVRARCSICSAVFAVRRELDSASRASGVTGVQPGIGHIPASLPAWQRVDGRVAPRSA